MRYAFPKRRAVVPAPRLPRLRAAAGSLLPVALLLAAGRRQAKTGSLNTKVQRPESHHTAILLGGSCWQARQKLQGKAAGVQRLPGADSSNEPRHGRERFGRSQARKNEEIDGRGWFYGVRLFATVPAAMQSSVSSRAKPPERIGNRHQVLGSRFSSSR